MAMHRIILAATAAVTLSACAGMTPRTDDTEINPVGKIIDRAQIERSGARNAFEAVKRARTHLDITDSGHDRRPASIGSRGRSSLVLNTQVHVVVDGTSVVNGVAALRSIQSGSIESIRILTAREATTVYGTAGGNGVIAVSTSSLVARR